MHPRVGVATSSLAPSLDEDGPLLLGALADAGLDAAPVLWDDDAVEWGSLDCVLVRSVWDYPLRRDEFLDWARRARSITNPRDVLRWNTDKRYLEDLRSAGVPIVPTEFLAPGAALPPHRGEIVIKPAVSSSAADTGRFGPGDPAADALLALLHSHGRTAMVQPYQARIESEGETSLLFLGGEFSHAMRREPLLTTTGTRRPVVVADVLSTVRPVTPTAEQLGIAQAALDASPGGRHALSYARVDLLPSDSGPVLLELEATDCFLFLGFAPPAALSHLAQSVARIAEAAASVPPPDRERGGRE
ncbi:MAG TPA: hypothetical protein VIL55_03635 [Naasia sp.]|jgi:glutathione synthase/RimK-type ligase-like ATP-grasp enzyme